MFHVLVTEQVDRDEWNRRVAQVAEGSYRQTTYYGDFKIRWQEQAFYLTALDPDQRVMGQLMVVRGSPFGWALERRPFAGVTLRLARWLYPCLYWAEGPVVFAAAQREEISVALLEKAVAEGRRRGCAVFRGTPSFYSSSPEEHRAVDRRAYERVGWQGQEKSTLMVDLRQDLEALWEGLGREARTKIRKARRDGIVIKPVDGSEEMLRQAHQVVVETARRNRVAALPFADFRRSFTYHHRLGLEQAFLSMYQEIPLSFQQVITYNGNALLGGVSYTDYSRTRHLYGNDLMQWHLIEWTKTQNQRWLDYGGAEPDSPDPKLRHIYEFKAKWGGQVIRYEHFVLSMRPDGMRRLVILPRNSGRCTRGGKT